MSKDTFGCSVANIVLIYNVNATVAIRTQHWRSGMRARARARVCVWVCACVCVRVCVCACLCVCASVQESHLKVTAPQNCKGREKERVIETDTMNNRKKKKESWLRSGNYVHCAIKRYTTPPHPLPTLPKKKKNRSSLLTRSAHGDNPRESHRLSHGREGGDIAAVLPRLIFFQIQNQGFYTRSARIRPIYHTRRKRIRRQATFSGEVGRGHDLPIFGGVQDRGQETHGGSIV